MAKYKKLLTPDYLRSADPSRGRAVFQKNCASCHTLFDNGGKVGPELTGSQRANLDYVLENVIDPERRRCQGVSGKHHHDKARTHDQRHRQAEDNRTLTLQTPNDVITVAVEDIDDRRAVAAIADAGRRAAESKRRRMHNLIAYLRSPTQVPLPKSP